MSNNIGKEIKLIVYSSKTQSVREVNVTPSNDWGGHGSLGVSIRFCSFEGAYENVWHILVSVRHYIVPIVAEIYNFNFIDSFLGSTSAVPSGASWSTIVFRLYYRL